MKGFFPEGRLFGIGATPVHRGEEFFTAETERSIRDVDTGHPALPAVRDQFLFKTAVTAPEIRPEGTGFTVHQNVGHQVIEQFPLDYRMFFVSGNLATEMCGDTGFL